MTQPPEQGPSDQWGRSQDQGPWNPPQNQGQWGQSQQGHGQWGQPPQGQWNQPQPPQWGQPEHQQQWAGQPGHQPQPGETEWGTPPAPKKSRRTALIAAVAAVVIVGGGAATYVAVSDKKGDAGGSSPHDAVASVVDDLNRSDVLGVLDHLPPAERDALRDPITDQVTQLKRLGVLNGSADPGKVSGTTLSVKNLGYASTDEKVSDHETIVKVTSGTVGIDADLSKVPFTQKFLQAAFGGHVPSGSSRRTVDLAKTKPLRIATIKVGGKWYPSLFYTIADYAAHDNGGSNPTSADYIAPNGSGSAEQAVRQFITAAGSGDSRRLIALMPPDEMAVMHDYGGLIAKTHNAVSTNRFAIEDSSFTTSKVTGGTLVSLESIKVRVRSTGTEFGLTVNGSCVTVSQGSQSENFCTSQLIDLAERSGATLSSAEKTALTHLASALPKIGIVAVQSGGKWYVDPIRTYSGLTLTMYKALSGDDLFALIQLGKQR